MPQWYKMHPKDQTSEGQLTFKSSHTMTVGELDSFWTHIIDSSNLVVLLNIRRIIDNGICNPKINEFELTAHQYKIKVGGFQIYGLQHLRKKKLTSAQSWYIYKSYLLRSMIISHPNHINRLLHLFLQQPRQIDSPHSMTSNRWPLLPPGPGALLISLIMRLLPSRHFCRAILFI